MKGLEEFGRIQLSKSFFMRDFLHSEIANFHGLPNIPDDPDLAVKTGAALCENLLEPLNATFGRVAVRSGFRSRAVTAFGNKRGMGASVESNSAYHIWDLPDREDEIGAAACVVVPWFAERYRNGADWRSLAWWIHDHLPYHHLQFFPKLCAFNIQWKARASRRIDSFIKSAGCLTRPGMANHGGSHAEFYRDFPKIGQHGSWPSDLAGPSS